MEKEKEMQTGKIKNRKKKGIAPLMGWPTSTCVGVRGSYFRPFYVVIEFAEIEPEIEPLWDCFV